MSKTIRPLSAKPTFNRDALDIFLASVDLVRCAGALHFQAISYALRGRAA